MKPSQKLLLALGGAVCALVVVGFLVLRRQAIDQPTEAATLSPAPPAPAESGPPPNLAEPPAGAVVFDLKYRVQTGEASDVGYRSYWGFGGSDTSKEPFIQEVRRKATKRLYCAEHALLKGRSVAAVEYEGHKLIALYFDLNADGKLADNERISPTKKTDDYSVEFITPDFRLQEDGEAAASPGALFRVLLRASFYGRNQEPNCIWSPACMLEGTTTIDGKNARMLLFANGFKGSFTKYGSASCALLFGDTSVDAGGYIPREPLSSLVRCDGRLYRLKFEGQRATGHAARAVLTRDTSPTGSLAVSLAGAQPLKAASDNVYLQGEDDKTVYITLTHLKDELPVGSYSLLRGGISYGETNSSDWQVSFSHGPKATLEAGKRTEVAIGEPVLSVRAVSAQERYTSDAKASSVFKKGTEIYLEPRIVGKGDVVLSRFTHRAGSSDQRADAPPKIVITSAAGKEVLSKTMEYG